MPVMTQWMTINDRVAKLSDGMLWCWCGVPDASSFRPLSKWSGVGLPTIVYRWPRWSGSLNADFHDLAVFTTATRSQILFICPCGPFGLVKGGAKVLQLGRHPLHGMQFQEVEQQFKKPCSSA